MSTDSIANSVKNMLQYLQESGVQSDVTLAYGLDPLLVHANIISIRSPVFGDLVEAARERERRILCGTGSVIANYLKDLDVEGKATAHMDMIRSHWVPPVTINMQEKTTISRRMHKTLVEFMYGDEYTLPDMMAHNVRDPNPDNSSLAVVLTTTHTLSGPAAGLVYHIQVYLAALKSWTPQNPISRFDMPAMAAYAQSEYRKALKEPSAWNAEWYMLGAHLLWEGTDAEEEKNGLNLRKDVALGYPNHIGSLNQHPELVRRILDLEGFEGLV